MPKRFSQLLQIREGEGPRVWWFSLCFFFLVSAFVVGKTARDTFFLSRFDPAYLPHVFIVVAIVMAVTVSIYTRIASRVTIFRAVVATSVISAVSLILIQISPEFPVIYAILYVWMEIITTILAIQFWLMANRAFTTREAKRLFGLIGAGGAFASIVAGFSIRPLVKSFGTDYLLFVTAGFILLAVVAVYFFRPFVTEEPPPRKRPVTHRMSEGKKPVSRHPLRNPYIRMISFAVAVSFLVATIVDYQLKIIASESLDEARLATLFGLLYGIIGIMSVFMQFLITGRILSRFGILWGLTFLPVALTTGSVMILLSPAIMSAVIAKAGDQIFRFTIHNSAGQLLWLPVSSREKDRAKPFVDGTVKNGAQAISGLVIIGIMHSFGVRFLSVPSILLLIVWIYANLKLKNGYVAELKRAIHDRQLDFESLEIDITDPLIVEALSKAISEGDDHQKLFGLDQMKGLPLSPWRGDLKELLKGGSTDIQIKILQLAREDREIIPDGDVVELMKNEADSLAAEAMIVCGERGFEEGAPLLQSTLSSENHRRRSAAAAGILLRKDKDASRAEAILNQMLYDPDNHVQIAALKSVGHIPQIVTDPGLQILLRDDSPDVRNLAIRMAAHRKSGDLIGPLIENLDSSATALSARIALGSYEMHAVTAGLLLRLAHDDAAENLTAGIVRCLGEYSSGSGADRLVDLLEDAEGPIAGEAVNALSKISRNTELSEQQWSRIDRLIKEKVLTAYNNFSLLEAFHDDNSGFLVIDYLQTTINREKSLILKLSLLRFPDSPVQTYLHTLTSGSKTARANVLEILDNLIARNIRETILPLFDDSPLEEKVAKGEHAYGTTAFSTRDEALMEWVQSRSRWVSAIALDYIFANKLSPLVAPTADKKGLEWAAFGDSILHREIITGVWKQNPGLVESLPHLELEQFIMKEIPMYSTLEKTIFLKGVDLFRDISGEEVSHVAQIAQEDRWTAGESIFHEGDPGDSMFIIVDGQVRIHKSEVASGIEREIAVLSKGEVIGEMALLDREPRSASATAADQAVLLQIGGGDFYDLMASRIQIMQGIVKVMTRRLREVIA